MKKKKTSSPSTFIMDDINKKTVRKYKRKKVLLRKRMVK